MTAPQSTSIRPAALAAPLRLFRPIPGAAFFGLAPAIFFAPVAPSPTTLPSRDTSGIGAGPSRLASGVGFFVGCLRALPADGKGARLASDETGAPPAVTTWTTGADAGAVGTRRAGGVEKTRCR